MVAAAAGVAAVLVPGFFLKGLCLAGATAMLATVATGYCPINAALDERRGDRIGTCDMRLPLSAHKRRGQ